jgi:hypothetical protein
VITEKVFLPLLIRNELIKSSFKWQVVDNTPWYNKGSLLAVPVHLNQFLISCVVEQKMYVFLGTTSLCHFGAKMFGAENCEKWFNFFVGICGPLQQLL